MKNKQSQNPEGRLLQSQAWAEMQKATGKEIVEIPTGKGNVIFGIINILPLIGKYLYIPRGTKNIYKYHEELKDTAKENICAWLRIEPLESTCRDTDFVVSPHDMQPRCVFQVSLEPTEEELLAQMKSKTRYNIRLAKKRGVIIKKTTQNDKDFVRYFDVFYTLIKETAQRKGVTFHKKEYYEKMFKHLPEKECILYVAIYKEVVIATNIIVYHDDTATYLHGSTADKHRNVMAPFLLQWQAITDAKKAGYIRYDFGGYFPDSSDVGKSGISRFKKGFTPHTKPLCMIGTCDIVISPVRYWLYRNLLKVKNILR